MKSEVAQSCPTLCDPMDCSLPGSSVHGIFQAKILEWVAISLSRGSSRPRDRTQVSHIAGKRFNLCTTREAQLLRKVLIKCRECPSITITQIFVWIINWNAIIYFRPFPFCHKSGDCQFPSDDMLFSKTDTALKTYI